MRKVTLICVFLVFALLLEDGSSVRKKTEEEEKEDEKMAEKVNATLAAEEAEKKKEEEDEAKRKKKEEKTEKKKEDEGERTDVKGRDEACPPSNSSCPIVGPYPREKVCPTVVCGPCPDVDPCPDCPPEKECPEVERCGPCPEIRPCKPCSVANVSTVEPPFTPGCPEPASMSTAVAMAVGACASLLITGLAAVIGLILRYFSPFVSGFIFMATIIFIWYFCSHHPEAARELGGRAATLLREAATALGHRVMAALQRQADQVGLSSLSMPNLFF
jgi:hypothetical protein